MLATLILMAFAAKPTGPEAEVRALVDAQVAAWNRADLSAFCSVYAGDALFLSPSGVTRGRAAVQARYEKKYGTNTKGMGKLAIEPIEIRVMDGAVTIAARWKLSFREKPPASGSTLIVFHKKPNGGWELVQDASM